MTTSFQGKQKEGNTAAKQSAGSFFSSFIQPKLSINEPGDEYEKEADAMADKVMRMKDDTTASHFFKPLTPYVQRKCKHCEAEEGLQRKETNESTAINSDGLDNYIGSLSGKGQSLPIETKAFLNLALDTISAR